MSIASEITRLQNAKAGLKTAIENKGVTVSASDTLDDYPALVDSISSGGGNITMYTYICLGGGRDRLSSNEYSTMENIQINSMNGWTSNSSILSMPDPEGCYYYRFTGGSFTNSGNHTIHAMCIGDENDTTIFSLYSPY